MTIIRRAIPEDVNEVHRLLCELEKRDFDPDVFAARYLNNLTAAEQIYIVAVAGGKVIGLLTCHGQNLLHHLGTTYEIQELIVNDDVRSRGIGKMLLDFLERELQDRDYEILEVASNVVRERAHAFYLREGFIKSHYKFTRPKSSQS